MQIKYKSIPLKLRDEIFHSFIAGIKKSKLAELYEIPYSTLRRFLNEELDKRELKGSLRVEYFNIEDFPYLEEGYTFQFAEHLTTWKVVSRTRKESDKVFVLVPSKEKGTKHYINDEELI